MPINIAIKALKNDLYPAKQRTTSLGSSFSFVRSLHELNSESSNRYFKRESRTAESLNNIHYEIQSTIGGLTFIIVFCAIGSLVPFIFIMNRMAHHVSVSAFVQMNSMYTRVTETVKLAHIKLSPFT